MKFFKSSIWLGTLLILSSCLHPQQLEQLGIILSRGIDKAENGEIEVNMAVLQFQKDAPSTTKTISGTGKTIKGAVRDANRKANQELVIGKLEIEVYDKELAEEGLDPLIDTLRRDANVPSTVRIAVSETKTKEVYNVDEEALGTNLGEFLHELIQPGVEKQMFPAVTLPRFAYTIKNPGIEPALPIMGLENGIPTITGLALFKGDRMVAQLPLDDIQLFQFLQGDVHDEMLELSLPADVLEQYLTDKEAANKQEDIHFSFVIEKGSARAVFTNKEKLKYDTDINIQLSLLEISKSYKLDQVKAIHHLEREIEKHIEQKYKDILTQLKELNVDTFGFGTYYRIKNKGGKLTDEEWDELYPKIDVNFNVHAEIIRHGEVHR